MVQLRLSPQFKVVVFGTSRKQISCSQENSYRLCQNNHVSVAGVSAGVFFKAFDRSTSVINGNSKHRIEELKECGTN